MVKKGIAHKKQICSVCGVEIRPGELMLTHPELNRWVHPECAEADTESKNNSKEVKMSDKQKTMAETFDELSKQFQIPQRSPLSPPPTEAEQKLEKAKGIQQMIVQDLRIMLETLPYVHPDWLIQSIQQFGDENITNFTRLSFLQIALKNLSRVHTLHNFIIAHLRKIMKDEQIEVGDGDEKDIFTLEQVLNRLSQRITQQTGGI